MNNVLQIMRLRPLANPWTLDHNNRNFEITSCQDFRLCAHPAGISRNYQINSMLPQQSNVCLFRKWTAINENAVLTKRRFSRRWLNKAQEIIMLLMFREFYQVHTSNRKHDTSSVSFKQLCRAVKVRYTFPLIICRRRPRWPRQRHKWNLRGSTGFNGMPAHLGRKRMGCINDMSNFLGCDIMYQSIYATKPSNSNRKGRPRRMSHTSRQRNRHGNIDFFESMCKRSRFSRTAKKKKPDHGS